MRKKTGIASGFTLMEIVIVIALTSVVLVTVFRALDRVRANEAKFDGRRQEEKEVYLLYQRLSILFKNMSSFKVFNNREEALYFRGSANEAIFLSRAPLISPYGGIHLVNLRFDGRALLYREKMSGTPAQGDFVSFEDLESQPFYELLPGVDRVRFQYYLYDRGIADFTWKEALNTFEKDPLPLKVYVDMAFAGNRYQFTFYKAITDENKEIPGDLLQ